MTEVKLPGTLSINPFNQPVAGTDVSYSKYFQYFDCKSKYMFNTNECIRNFHYI